MLGQPPSAVQSSEARLLWVVATQIDKKASGLRHEDSCWRLSPHKLNRARCAN